MSRMTKFLKQTVEYQPMLRNAQGEPQLDLYGEPTYGPIQKLKCRRERSIKDILTVTGSMARSETTYYIDEQNIVSLGDLMDGKPIVDYEEYTNEHGKTEGYRVMV